MRKYSIFDHNWLAHYINNNAIKKKLPQMHGVVYDLGCGIRPYEDDVLQYAEKYIGVDWSNTLHDLKADIIANLNEPLPIKMEVADNIVSFQVLEHLSEPQLMLSEAFRILKPNGKIFLAVPFQWWVHEPPYDYFRYTRYGLDHLFKKAGFKNIEIKDLTGFWAMWLLKLNYQLVRGTRFGPKFLQLGLRIVLTPLWLSNQLIAIVLDKYWPCASGETAWYFVVGEKIEST